MEIYIDKQFIVSLVITKVIVIHNFTSFLSWLRANIARMYFLKTDLIKIYHSMFCSGSEVIKLYTQTVLVSFSIKKKKKN